MSLEGALREAARDGKPRVAKSLLKRGADVNAAEEVDGWAPLHYAANGNSTRHYDTAVVLLEAEADVDVANDQGETPLHIGVARGNEQMVDLLLESGASLEAVDNRGRDAFFIAAQHSQAITAKIASLMKRTIFGRTRTNLGSQEGIGEKKREQEEQKKHEQELRDSAEGGDLIGVEDVLDLYEGINIDAVNDQGDSALWLASFNGRHHVVQELLDRGADPTQPRPDSGQIALHIAAEQGYVPVVRVLLTRLEKANVDATDALGRTPLFVAAFKNYANVVKLLLDNNADINLPNKSDESPLYIAASEGHAEVVQTLLGADEPQRSELAINAPDKKGYTPLHVSASKGNIMITRAILDRQANVEARNFNGETPLFLAAEAGHARMATVLLENYSADADADNRWGETPLYVASLRGHVTVVDILIENKGELEAVGERGMTALMVAAQEGQNAVIERLLKSGANIHAANYAGETPLLVAALEGYYYTVTLLLNNGADMKAAQNEGKTALHLASRDGHVGVVEVLLNKAKQIEGSSESQMINLTPLHMTADTRGETALHSAVRFGHVSVVELLLKHDDFMREKGESDSSGATSLIYGRLADAPNKYGWTAMHVAVDSQRAPALAVLLRHKAHVNPSDRYGNKPLHVASRQRDPRMVEELLKVPGTDVSSVNVDGRTPLHIAAACVRPKTVVAQLESGGDSLAQDKYGRHAVDVLGDLTVCNPDFSLLDGMCVKDSGDGVPKFKLDLCPVAQGAGADTTECIGILKAAMNKTASTTSIRSGVNPLESSSDITHNTAGVSGGGSPISVALLAGLVPLVAIVLFLMAAFFVLAIRRQRRLSHNAGKGGRRKKGSSDRNFTSKAGKKGAVYFQKGVSPRTVEAVPADLYTADPRDLLPLDSDHANSSPFHDTDVGNSSDAGSSSSEDGSCFWSDISDNGSPTHRFERQEPGPSVQPANRNLHEIHVARTMSKSSSDGEMHEREKRDALGPLPSERAPKNRHARGWLVGKSSSGRRLIGLNGGNCLPPRHQVSRDNFMAAFHQELDQELQVSEPQPKILDVNGVPSLNSTSNFEVDSTKVPEGRSAAPRIDMQRQWSWS